MSSVRLAESTITLIESKVKSDISSALSEVRDDRSDAKVSTEPPKNYFRYPGAKSYQCPSVFTICESFSIRNHEMGANHINANAKVMVSVLVEDRTLDNLVLKTWRYQSALFKVLHLTSLTSQDGNVKLMIKVEGVRFSPEFSDSQDPNTPQGTFRKEVVLDLDVEHIENL